jgi:hypothetical protein
MKDRAGRPMFDKKGNKLSIREREYAARIIELEQQLAEAQKLGLYWQAEAERYMEAK